MYLFVISQVKETNELGMYDIFVEELPSTLIFVKLFCLKAFFQCGTNKNYETLEAL